MEPNLHLWSPSSWTQRLFDAMKHTATVSTLISLYPTGACSQLSYATVVSYTEKCKPQLMSSIPQAYIF